MARADIPEELLSKFLELAGKLSPENLSCDGEAPTSLVARKYRRLKRQWRQLEVQAGRTVTEDEVWDYEYANQG